MDLRGVAKLNNNYDAFDIDKVKATKYLFFTGKGGVGKTSTACSVAVNLADQGQTVLLISTDPASNLEDVFGTAIDGAGVEIKEVPRLTVVNINPEEAAHAYRESVVGPYRGKLPALVIENMEEQLSGSCTVEIAAFDQFSKFISDANIESQYDHIVFDTAPTGHTLRMLQLPAAWSNFISESTHGSSCLGQLSGLEAKKDTYKQAVLNLSDAKKTTLILVSRPEASPLLEAERSSIELKALHIDNQILIINGILEHATDPLSQMIKEKQINAIRNIPKSLTQNPIYTIPLRTYNVMGVDKMRLFFKEDRLEASVSGLDQTSFKAINALVDDLVTKNKKVIFTMGKGGVGKTSVATSIAFALSQRGIKVHLTSTDPANHVDLSIQNEGFLRISRIDEKVELENYQNEVLSKARETMDEADLAYIEEDLRSPCTQEVALFRAFAEVVDHSEDEVVVIDTAPTGHTLLLLDATESYHKEVQRSKGETPEAVQKLLPKLRDADFTEVIIVTLPEATPVFEAERLREDLKRAGINNTWWVINQSLSKAQSSDTLIKARAHAEGVWMDKVKSISSDHFVVIPWLQEASITNMLK